eukprot:12928926-Prorocentrum_lima.AAC.1
MAHEKAHVSATRSLSDMCSSPDISALPDIEISSTAFNGSIEVIALLPPISIPSVPGGQSA